MTVVLIIPFDWLHDSTPKDPPIRRELFVEKHTVMNLRCDSLSDDNAKVLIKFKKWLWFFKDKVEIYNVKKTLTDKPKSWFWYLWGDTHLFGYEKELLYEGTLRYGKCNGYGKLYNNGQLKYEGNFLNGDYDGCGKLYYDNQIIYNGMFKNCLYEGQGKLYKNGQLMHDGIFKNGDIETDEPNEELVMMVPLKDVDKKNM